MKITRLERKKEEDRALPIIMSLNLWDQHAIIEIGEKQKTISNRLSKKILMIMKSTHPSVIAT